MDTQGDSKISFKDLMISLGILLGGNLKGALKNAFEIFDYEKKEILEKNEFIRIFRISNMLLLNFGDKNLLDSQLFDLINSVYTSSGKIDGCICYNDYLPTIVEHPIIQLSLSVQFQGSGREKMRNLLSNEKAFG
jgi:Ca2+-binding EF-hand superfamily protein